MIKAHQPPIATVHEFLTELSKLSASAENALKEAALWTNPTEPPARGGTLPNPFQQAGTPNKPQAPTGGHPDRRNTCNGLCFGCGRQFLAAGPRCAKCTDLPDRNMQDVPFVTVVLYTTVLKDWGATTPQCLQVLSVAFHFPIIFFN